MRYAYIIFTLLCISIFWNLFSQVSAENKDYINWKDKFIIYTEYDSWDQELNIRLWVDVSGPTDSDYTIKFDIINDTCETDLNFSSTTYKVEWECDVKIAEEDMRWIFTVQAVIKDEDGDIDYDGEIQFEVDGYGDSFDWDDLDITARYNGEDQDLYVDFVLHNVTRIPDKEYSIELNINDRDLSKDLKYKQEDNILIAEFSLSINDDDIEDDYYVDFDIISEDIDNEEQREDSIRKNIDVEILKTDDEFNWNDAHMFSVYDEQKERLEVFFVLPEIKEKPLRKYSIYMDVAGKQDDRKLDWNPEKDELSASMVVRIKQEDADRSYDADIRVTNDKSKSVFNEDFSVDVDTKRAADDFSWNNLQTQALYFKEEAELDIIYTLKIWPKALHEYTVDTTFDGGDYEKLFSYDADDGSLHATVTVDVDSDDLLDQYEIESVVTWVKAEGVSEKVYNTTTTLSVIEKENREAARSVVTADGEQQYSLKATYDENRELLRIHVDMLNVVLKPSSDYTVEMTTLWKTQKRTMRYNAQRQILGYPFSIHTSASDLRERYSVYVVIKDSKGKMVYTTREVIAVGEESVWWTNNTSSTTNTSWNTSVGWDEKINAAIDRFIEKIEKKYPNISQRKQYLQYTMQALDRIAEKKPKYKSLVTQINNRIQNRLNFYDDVLSELNIDL